MKIALILAISFSFSCAVTYPLIKWMDESLQVQPKEVVQVEDEYQLKYEQMNKQKERLKIHRQVGLIGAL